MSTSAARLPPSLDELREKRDQLRAQLALLSASRPTKLAPLPSSTSRTLARLPIQSVQTRTDTRLDKTLPGGGASSSAASSALDDAAERARRYRLTGRSVFGVELARGKRAKLEELEKNGKGKGKARAVEEGEEAEVEVEFVRKGVGVRLETYWRGRFFEPFYLVFDRVRRAPDATPSDSRLQLVHHTIPPFLPLRQLCLDYLGVPIRGQTALYGDDEEEALPARSRGAKEPDLDLFLTHLQTYLDAYIARRQSLELLRLKYSRAEHAPLRLAVFASAAADKIVVEWDLPTLVDSEAEEQQGQGEGAGVSRQVVLQVGFVDLRGAAVGAHARRGLPGGAQGVSLLGRYVERRAGRDPPNARILRNPPDAPHELDALVDFWVTRTTQPGWTPDD